MAWAEHELSAWLRLTLTSGVGADSAHKLLSAFGLPENIFAAPFSQLLEVVSERMAQALQRLPDGFADQLARTLTWLNEPNNHVLCLADADYPQHLLTIADPPTLLYVKGRCALLNFPAIAIVGSRNATQQGEANAEQFASSLARAGLTVVSGLALGIDAAAHRGALMSHAPELSHAATIAVIGTGCDIIYPARNRSLAHQIAQQGVIVSEFPLATPALAHNFPRRNRIISGLARGVLVVEAAAQSGSLITARMAAEQGREVFAIPGSIHSPVARGCHKLIKQGAKLVEAAEDILEELGGQIATPEKTNPIPLQPPLHAQAPLKQQPENNATMPKKHARALFRHDGLSYEPITSLTTQNQRHDSAAAVTQETASRDGLVNALGFDPMSFDQLCASTGLNAEQLTARLTDWELEGWLERLPGGRWQRLTV